MTAPATDLNTAHAQQNQMLTGKQADGVSIRDLQNKKDTGEGLGYGNQTHLSDVQITF